MKQNLAWPSRLRGPSSPRRPAICLSLPLPTKEKPEPTYDMSFNMSSRRD